MRKYASYILMALVASVVSCLTACLSDEETESTPQCVITSFSVGDITTTLTTLASDGTDSAYTRTISGSSIKFNIDQVNGRIYSVDSLPSWTNLTRVVPTISCSGTAYARLNADEKFYEVTSGSDSIDLSTPMDFRVVASDGVSYKHYTAVIYRYSANADSLLWSELDADLKIDDAQKAVVDGDMIYLFGQYEGNAAVSMSNDGKQWTAPAAIQSASDIDLASILAYNGKLYAKGSNNGLYGSEDGIVWALATDKQIQSLLACDANYLYAYDGEKIIATADLNEWTVNGTKNLSMLPQTNLSYASYATRTNSTLSVCVMAGLNAGNAENAVVWYKVSAANDESNQTWDYIEVTEENPYPLAALGNLCMFHYNDALYAFGGSNDVFYKSEDNGITWREVEQYQFPPSSLVADKHVAAAVMDQQIFMIQTDNDGRTKVWRGILNKFQ